MAKIKRHYIGENCPHALCPFGKGAPLCSYGLELKAGVTVKDFKICMDRGVCHKENDKKLKTEEMHHDEQEQD